MDNLEHARSAPNLTKALYPFSKRKLCNLRLREMKKPQGYRATAIINAHQQGTSLTYDNLRQQHLAANKRFIVKKSGKYQAG